MRFPSELGDLTPEWLTSVLAESYPGTEVTSLTVGSIIKGTATKVRLMLTYNDAGHRHRLPPTLWVKGGYEEHSRDQWLAYATETNFYRDLAPALDIGCPRAWIAYTDPGSLQSLLLLEDLLARNVTFGHPSKPVSPEMAAKVLAILAKLHAHYWKNEQRGKEQEGSEQGRNEQRGREPWREFDWLKHGGHLLQSDVIQGLYAPANWERAIASPCGEFVRDALRDRALVSERMLAMLRSDAERSHCLVHGDPHIGNLCFDQDGNPVYLDWQTIMPGFWAHDVADFITTGLTIADRRHAERDLIAHYLQKLAEYGVRQAPAFDEAWLEYRRHALYNFNWVLCLPEWQPEEARHPCSERACAAILDLDSLSAW